MSSRAESLITPRPGIVVSNATCFTAMVMWSFAFPIAEFMLATWDAVALVLVRLAIGVAALSVCWLWLDGWARVHGVKR